MTAEDESQLNLKIGRKDNDDRIVEKQSLAIHTTSSSCPTHPRDTRDECGQPAQF